MVHRELSLCQHTLCVFLCVCERVMCSWKTGCVFMCVCECVCFLFGGEVIRRVKVEALHVCVCELGSNVKMLVFPSRISRLVVLLCVTRTHRRTQLLKSPSHCLQSAGWHIFHFCSFSKAAEGWCPLVSLFIQHLSVHEKIFKSNESALLRQLLLSKQNVSEICVSLVVICKIKGRWMLLADF